jgi:hypothetical protein
MRAFLVHYEQWLSIAIAAECARISGRLPYIWKNRKDRTGRWFRLALTRAEHAGLQRLRGEGVRRAFQHSDAVLLAILRARDSWFMPKDKAVPPKTAIQVNATQNNNYANAQYSAAGLTDEELETIDRLLRKMGVPQALLEAGAPPPSDAIDAEKAKS